MGFNNREKEIKLLVEGCADRKKIDKLCRKLFRPVHTVDNKQRTDYFWTSPKCNFYRVRQMGDKISGPGQTTVKKCDKGDNVDRLEIDVDVDNALQAIKQKTADTGKKPDTVCKIYSVLFLDDKETNISVYQVANDKNVFIEVEARNLRQVNQIVNSLKDLLPYNLRQIKNSLYEMFVLGIGKP
jgi:hypothetical protein